MGRGGEDQDQTRQRQSPDRARGGDRPHARRARRRAPERSEPPPRNGHRPEGGRPGRPGRARDRRACPPGRNRDRRRHRGAGTPHRNARHRRRQSHVRDGSGLVKGAFMKLGTLAVAIGLTALAVGSAAAQPDGSRSSKAMLTVYAAASVTDAFPKIAPSPRYSFGGSNALAAQIRQGAPADVFASANMTLPQQLY